MSSEGPSLYLLTRTLHNRVLSRELIASAQRVTRRGRDLIEEVHERRRRPDFFNRLAKHVQVFPRMRRFLPLRGGDGDSLRIETKERPEGLVFRLSGEVDLANVDRLKVALRPVVSNCRNVVLDARDLKYIDSTGLRVLIDASQELLRSGCRLVVVGASSVTAKLVRVLHVETLLPLVSSIEEAVELLRENAASAASDG